MVFTMHHILYANKTTQIEKKIVISGICIMYIAYTGEVRGSCLKGVNVLGEGGGEEMLISSPEILSFTKSFSISDTPAAAVCIYHGFPVPFMR